MSQDEDKALDAAWRRASAADAGRPSAKTRAAILAEAAAQARRRQPAANEPRYWMRVVAGVAVVGVGVMLWRQTDVRLPGEPPVVVVPVVQEESAVTVESAAPSEQGFSQAPPAESPAAPPSAGREDSARRRVDVAEEQERKAAAADVPSPPAEQAVPVAPPPVQIQAPVTTTAQDAAGGREADEGLDLQEVQVTGTRVQRRERAVGPRAMPGATTAPRTGPAPTAAELLRTHFPQQNASAQPHRLWVVLDAASGVVAMGELEPDQQLETLASQIERDAGRSPGPWQVERISNARGQPIELAISRLPR